MRRVLGVLLSTALASLFAFSSAYAAETPTPGRSDVGDYEQLVLATRVERSGNPDDPLISWRDTAIGYVVAWQEFIDRYPQSIFVPAAYIRMAEWYLTIKKTDGRPNWYVDEQNRDPNAIKDNPGLLDPVYAREAHKLLTKVIREYKDYPHYSYVGDGRFEWNDKVVAVALYDRAMFFRGSCRSDLERLAKEFPGLPSTRDAHRDLQNSKTCK